MSILGPIRPMRPDDIPDCCALAGEAWGKATAQIAQPDFVEAFSASPWRPFFLVATDDDGVIGVAGHGPSRVAYGIHTLMWVVVAKRRQGRGIGRRLVARCLHHVGRIADVAIVATQRPTFYEHCFGFARLAHMALSDSPVDTLLMKRFGAPAGSGDAAPGTGCGR